MLSPQPGWTPEMPAECKCVPVPVSKTFAATKPLSYFKDFKS